MPGLLFSAYQKFYSALSHLERFDKESNFFDNISAIDSFFNEYRNVTFVMQESLSHTEFFSAYEKNRDLFLTDHWFVKKRNETIKFLACVCDALQRRAVRRDKSGNNFIKPSIG